LRALPTDNRSDDASGKKVSEKNKPRRDDDIFLPQ